MQVYISFSKSTMAQNVLERFSLLGGASSNSAYILLDRRTLFFLSSAPNFDPTTSWFEEQQSVSYVWPKPLPVLLQQLLHFVWLITFYSRFIPNCAGKLSPLTNLLNENEQQHSCFPSSSPNTHF